MNKSRTDGRAMTRSELVLLEDRGSSEAFVPRLPIKSLPSPSTVVA